MAGAVVLAVPVLGACDFSQFCNGFGNEARACAAELLGGDAVNVPTGRGMARWNQPDPSAGERQSCEQVVTDIYAGKDEVRKLYAIEACRVLVNYGTRNKPSWISVENQAWSVAP